MHVSISQCGNMGHQTEFLTGIASTVEANWPSIKGCSGSTIIWAKSQSQKNQTDFSNLNVFKTISNKNERTAIENTIEYNTLAVNNVILTTPEFNNYED